MIKEGGERLYKCTLIKLARTSEVEITIFLWENAVSGTFCGLLPGQKDYNTAAQQFMWQLLYLHRQRDTMKRTWCTNSVACHVWDPLPRPGKWLRGEKDISLGHTQVT